MDQESLQKALKKEAKKGQPVIDIFDINRLRRRLLANSYAWDRCLMLAASSDTSLHLELISSMAKHNEKPVESNLSSKPNGSFTNSQSLPSDLKLNEASVAIFHSVDDQRGGIEQDFNYGIENNSSLSTIMNSSDRPQPLESAAVVRRAFSDSQFPVMENLSDSLDAAWTGKNHPESVVPLENGSGLSDATTFNSPIMPEAEVLIADVYVGDRAEVEATRSVAPVIPFKGVDRADDFPNWIAILNYYRASNRNSFGSAPTFEALGEYNPMYVSSFRELERQGGARLRLPVGINETVVPVYDDEPTSIISYALISKDYHSQLLDEKEKPKDNGDSSISFSDMSSFLSLQSFDDSIAESLKSFGSTEDSILSISGNRSSLAMDPLLYTKALHARVSFTDESSSMGKVKYTVTCYYAKRFDALRRTCCPSEFDFIRSLSRCKKWGAQGGKSNVFFAKTLDDRFIIKQVTKTELESFIKFAPAYFKYLSESIDSGCPTCLAKILGIYQVWVSFLKALKTTSQKSDWPNDPHLILFLEQQIVKVLNPNNNLLFHDMLLLRRMTWF